MTRYIVSGPRKAFGYGPGEEFEAEIPEAQERRMIDRGAIRIAPPHGLSALSREELNALAEDAGIEDPEQLPNISAVIEAIEAKHNEPAASGDGEE